MRRLTLFVLASLFTLTACAADPAVQDARDHVDRVADLLTGFDPWVAEDVGYYLTQEEKEHLTVLDVSGDGREDPGRVRIKVRGKDRTTRPPMASPGVSLPAVAVFLCFDLEVVAHRPVTDHVRPTKADRRVNVTQVGCPEGSPRRFRPPAVLPARTDSWLKKHLPTTFDLGAARRAVRGLNLDPRIRQDVAEFDGKIGIALQEPDGDCLFARVWPSTVQVWSPWRPWAPPVLPAERACSAAQAASGYSY
ncbi:hypothetical protein [Nonomuraea dietziae]|uniref:hypothetical protein n=1 Tax=Nonomuraea dietziae TaxID=65515 RepID=UPI0034001CC1